MTQSTELERTIVPRHDARGRAFAGALALRIVRAADGNEQMRRRAFVTGGDS